MGYESEEGESFSGFSEVESENSFSTPVASTSGVGGVTRRRFVASAASRPAKRHRMAPHGDGDNDEQRPSCSRDFTTPKVRARTLRRRASAPGPLCATIPCRGAAVASCKTPGVLVWSDGDNFVPLIPAFDNTDVGITDLFPDTGADMCEMDYFTAYFDEPLMEYIVQQTNLHAAYLIEKELSDFSRLQRWKNTTVGEMYVFLALCMLMGQFCSTNSCL